ncbi:CDP-alcohol phosphatidyltransferase family protein [Methanobrevibacter sp. TMH8]|uniref:CDP-alcohol phosphatidyltransferase family protein n=1 Tax=Methanobrevibacter sp. TMH8 TaxID=2848611 RepID=UPI001CCBC487|nr:CDP-alcohol phosphatidyltransferase family protein [Methanobrevibacter sp. TMH8]MBZ9571184.1 CDP-alcohol phosphatidyltransferase family protein [Methanobrevibacter sp. TMH8]
MDLKETKIGYFMAVSDVISLLNLSFGFLSILMAINGQIAISAIFIIIALVFDSIDGWVARKLSRIDEYGFGKNIDSLSDVVSFGVAPGILLYCIGTSTIQNSLINHYYFGLSQFTQFINLIGLNYLLAIVALFIVICGVLRLTRYNAIVDNLNFKGFIGVPIPATGVLLSSFVLSGFFNLYIAMILMVIMGLLMISNIKYSKLDNPKYLGIFAIFLILILIPYPIVFWGIDIPASVVFVLTLIYVLIGLFKGLLFSKSDSIDFEL